MKCKLFRLKDVLDENLTKFIFEKELIKLFDNLDWFLIYAFKIWGTTILVWKSVYGTFDTNSEFAEIILVVIK